VTSAEDASNSFPLRLLWTTSQIWISYEQRASSLKNPARAGFFFMRNTHRQLRVWRSPSRLAEYAQFESTRGEPNVKSTLSMLAATSLAAGLLLSLAACTDTAKEPEAENPALAAPVPEAGDHGLGRLHLCIAG
jgi:hypothetical protein